MLLEVIVNISILISSKFLSSHYFTKNRQPMSKSSSIPDKLVYGFIYGLVGICLMYVHKYMSSGVADIRQLVVLLSLFYGGWIPSLVSISMITVFRWFLFPEIPIIGYLISMTITLIIAPLVLMLRIQRSKQWYLVSILVLLEISVVLWFQEVNGSQSEIFHFVIAFLIGSVCSYHFAESLRHTYQINQELIQSKKKLELSEANYRLIAEHSTDMIAVLSEDGLCEYLSPSHESILGIKIASRVRKSIRDLIHPDDLEGVSSVIDKARKGESPILAEYRFQHSDGSWVWLETSYVPVCSYFGDVPKIISISRDITKRKRTEEIFRDKEKLFVVGELAAGIAHEIRNPLTTIKGFIQLIKKDAVNPMYTTIMLEELERIEEITNELLYLGKPQAQTAKETNMNDIIEQTVMLMQPQALLHGIMIQVEYQTDLPSLYCVENHLKQVFINLIKNSIEAMPEGGELQVGSKLAQNWFTIFVKDTGVGIPEDRIEKLGQPFYSLKEKGTGLGLTICNKIVQEHGGTLTFQSQERVGTMAEVRLPIKKIPISSLTG